MMSIIPTYMSSLNDVLGGGIPNKGLVEVFGDEGAGKTGMVLSLSQHVPLFFFDLDGTFPEHLSNKLSRYDSIWRVSPPMKDANSILSAIEGVSNITIALDPVAVIGQAEMCRLIPPLCAMINNNSLCVIMVNHCNKNGKSVASSSLSLYATQRIEVRLESDIRKKVKGRMDSVGMKVSMRCIKDVTGRSSMCHANEEIYF